MVGKEWYVGKNIARLLEERPKLVGRMKEREGGVAVGAKREVQLPYSHARHVGRSHRQDVRRFDRPRTRLERVRRRERLPGTRELPPRGLGLRRHEQRVHGQDGMPLRVRKYAESMSKVTGEPLEKVMGSRGVKTYFQEMYGD